MFFKENTPFYADLQKKAKTMPEKEQHRTRVLLGDIRLQVGVIEEFLDKVPQ